jgi:protein-L-isoaspartate(D-aspartate) O-methyltransferase
MRAAPPRAPRRRLLGAGLGAAFAGRAHAQRPSRPDEAEFARRRARMVEEIAATAAATAGRTGRARFSERVMTAMATVPRHRFVPESALDAAYADRPLPIGAGQTISQPFVVALSTELLDLRPGDAALDVGTGSGYQAAVLSGLVARVHSIEIVESLGREAASRLAALGYRNVEVTIGDGFAGWPQHAPYDAIVVAAAAPAVPPALLEQLAPGGRMVIPIGAEAFGQDLVRIEKRADGSVEQRRVLPVRFVPMTGEGVRERR